MMYNYYLCINVNYYIVFKMILFDVIDRIFLCFIVVVFSLLMKIFLGLYEFFIGIIY